MKLASKQYNLMREMKTDEDCFGNVINAIRKLEVEVVST